MGFRVWGLGFRVQFRVQGLGFEVLGPQHNNMSNEGVVRWVAGQLLRRKLRAHHSHKKDVMNDAVSESSMCIWPQAGPLASAERHPEPIGRSAGIQPRQWVALVSSTRCNCVPLAATTPSPPPRRRLLLLGYCPHPGTVYHRGHLRVYLQRYCKYCPSATGGNTQTTPATAPASSFTPQLRVESLGVRERGRLRT